MTRLGKYDLSWKATRALKDLKRQGDQRQMFVSFDPDVDAKFPYVLHAFGPADSELPAWDLGPQNVHGDDAA